MAACGHSPLAPACLVAMPSAHGTRTAAGQAFSAPGRSGSQAVSAGSAEPPPELSGCGGLPEAEQAPPPRLHAAVMVTASPPASKYVPSGEKRTCKGILIFSAFYVAVKALCKQSLPITGRRAPDRKARLGSAPWTPFSHPRPRTYWFWSRSSSASSTSM